MKQNLIIAITGAIFILSCKSRVAKLPELEKSLADRIVQLENQNVWVTAVNVTDTNRSVSSTLRPDGIRQGSTKYFDIAVYYPIVICRWPADELSPEQGRNLFGDNHGMLDLVNSNKRDNAFKLSASARLRTETSLWCRTVTGPWLVQVAEVGNCVDVSVFTIVTFYQGGKKILFSWSGYFVDHAADYGLTIAGSKLNEHDEPKPC